MAVPVIIPELQFIDADGHPYAGGTLETYITGTTTPKTTWVDPEQAALNTNPIVLDAAGRCLCWGDGEYRLILRDSAGNLVWDQPATTIVSAAMAPVVAAPTIADAVHMLGIDDLIAAEAAARAAADASEQAARIAADNALTDITDELRTDLDAEIARALAAEAALQSQIDGTAGTPLLLSGFGNTDASGLSTVTFTTPFSVAPAVVATVWSSSLPAFWLAVNPTTTGFTVTAAIPLADDAVHPAPSVGFCWIANGVT